jgi:hypothetical protein
MSPQGGIMQTAINAEEGLQCKEAAEAVQGRTLLLGGWEGRRRKGSCQHLLPFLVFLAEAGYDSRARCCLCWIVCCERHLHCVKVAAGPTNATQQIVEPNQSAVQSLLQQYECEQQRDIYKTLKILRRSPVRLPAMQEYSLHLQLSHTHYQAFPDEAGSF